MSRPATAEQLKRLKHPAYLALAATLGAVERARSLPAEERLAVCGAVDALLRLVEVRGSIEAEAIAEAARALAQAPHGYRVRAAALAEAETSQRLKSLLVANDASPPPTYEEALDALLLGDILPIYKYEEHAARKAAEVERERFYAQVRADAARRAAPVDHEESGVIASPRALALAVEQAEQPAPSTARSAR